jgi:hypothetical protein
MMLDLECAREWAPGENEHYGEVFIDENNRRRILNLDESSTSLDGASGNAGGRPTFTIWDVQKSCPGGSHNKYSCTATLVVAGSAAEDLLPPHFQFTTAAKKDNGLSIWCLSSDRSFHDVVTHFGIGIPTACHVTFGKNEKGGMSEDEFETYIMNFILPLFPDARHIPGKRVLLKMDWVHGELMTNSWSSSSPMAFM